MKIDVKINPDAQLIEYSDLFKSPVFQELLKNWRSKADSKESVISWAKNIAKSDVIKIYLFSESALKFLHKYPDLQQRAQKMYDAAMELAEYCRKVTEGR